MMAAELYRAMKRVEALERQIGESAPGTPGRDELEQELRKARAELAYLKSIMEGAKDRD